MQFQMPFDESSGAQPAPLPLTEAVGILTGRIWEGRIMPTAAVVDGLRRDLPLPRRASDHLLSLLGVRGFDSAEDLDPFFFPSLAHLHDPLLLDEIDLAARRLLAAAATGERVAMHGDFDVDGLTGTALLAELLGDITVDGSRMRSEPPFVPDRVIDGYGVSARMIRAWGENGVTLLVTVDTGAAAHDELALAAELGMEVIVLDHHLFGERPTGATVLVNPHRAGNRYPNPELCGVAVAFKLAQAVVSEAPAALSAAWPNKVLDLCALGLIADQMALTGENRTLVQCGLKILSDRTTLRPGLAALLQVSGLERGLPISATDVSYQIAPRLNACGRVGRVETALRLLLTDDPAEAAELAAEADRSNELRKQMDLQMKEDAASVARPFVDRGDPGLVLGSPAWHKGVIGISASRLVEMFNVPTILCAIEGGEARGSARSIPGVDVKVALDRCAGLLVRYGGHAQAAGVTLRVEDLDDFRAAFIKALVDTPAGAVVTETYDLLLPLGDMVAGDVAQLCEEVQLMAPFGEGHRAPLFRCDGLRMKRLPTTLGKGGEHLRFAFAGSSDPRTGGSPALGREFVAFGSGRAWNEWVRAQTDGPRAALDVGWDVLFQINPNTWRPRDGRAVDPVQQLLVDLKPSES